MNDVFQYSFESGVRETPARVRRREGVARARVLKPSPEPPRSLGPLEKEWKEQIHRRLLDVMDLSLIDTLSKTRRGRIFATSAIA